MTAAATVPTFVWVIACFLAGYGIFAFVRDLRDIWRER